MNKETLSKFYRLIEVAKENLKRHYEWIDFDTKLIEEKKKSMERHLLEIESLKEEIEILEEIVNQ